MTTDEADPIDIEEALNGLDFTDVELPHLNQCVEQCEHIVFDHDEFPDQLAIHDPEDSADAWVTAHGDAFQTLAEAR